MPENNNVEFTFDYDEAETVDRLKALTTASHMFMQRGMQKAVAGGDETDDISIGGAVLDMQKELEGYARAKGYDLGAYHERILKMNEEVFCCSPLEKAYFKAIDEREKEASLKIDESQFEVPNQNQRTL